METYSADIICYNCMDKRSINIPKGVTKDDWMIENPDCPNCGCYLRTYWDPIALKLFHRKQKKGK